MLRGIADLPRPLFVTCPDIVGDGPGTLALFRQWMPALHGLGLPAGLVAQDGMTAGELDSPLIDAVFIGGTDGFKMGPEAAAIGREAKRRGLWLHMGRVNGHRRVMYAKAIGCDSVDGSSLTWFKDRWLARFLERARADPGDVPVSHLESEESAWGADLYPAREAEAPGEAVYGSNSTTNVRAAGVDDLREVMSDTEILERVKADWERRMSTRRGRVLLWLLRG